MTQPQIFVDIDREKAKAQGVSLDDVVEDYLRSNAAVERRLAAMEHRRGDGFELLGRAALAEPRGCSLLAA